MKIASFADKENSAIDRLCKMDEKRFGHLQYRHICVHPKHPNEEELGLASQLIKWADIIHCAYWKTAVMLRKNFPEMNRKKLILTHQNEHNINDTEKDHWEWKDMNWDLIIVKNKWQLEQLRNQRYEPFLIRHAIEFDNFSYIPILTKEKVVGYCGQIKKVKGIRELAQACRELKYKLLIIGKPSEAQYWADIPKENIIYYPDVPDEKIGEIYHSMRVFVCNSNDGTESGTLPILEAMASGIPVVTRNIGHVRDFGEDTKNMIIRNGEINDIPDLKNSLQLVMENDKIADTLRENAWRTVRQYHPDVHAREYNRIFHQVMYPDTLIVSIIIPTFNRAHLVTMQFEEINKQLYRNFEVIIADDGSTDDTKKVVEQAKKVYDYPIKYINTGDTESYGLTKARNMAIEEALGEILVFCDDRLRMDYLAIDGFVKALKEHSSKKIWIYGSKGVFKQFVENFSATWRRTIIDGGMFNERINKYGGITQEISRRFAAQKVLFQWCPEAFAEPILGTHSKSKHRQDIIDMKIKLYKLGYQ